MKKVIYIIGIIILSSSCQTPPQQEDNMECTKVQKEVENLKIKLAATEAQLLNVQAELSKCKAADSTAVKVPE